MTVQSACTKNTRELTDADFFDPSAKSPTKRQYPRRAAKWQVVIKTTQGKQIKGMTVNVSKEGMMISLPCNLTLGDKTFISSSVLYQGSQISLQGVAVVRHCSVNGSFFNIGFQFTRATDLTTRFLDKYASV